MNNSILGTETQIHASIHKSIYKIVNLNTVDGSLNFFWSEILIRMTTFRPDSMLGRFKVKGLKLIKNI